MHYAAVTLANPGGASAHLRVGVAQADFDPADGAASAGPLGWAWVSDGAGRHADSMTEHFMDGGQWGQAGDTLTLELDCDRGRLCGWLRDTRLGAFAKRLHTQALPSGTKREFVWCVEMSEAGTEFCIQHAAPRPVDAFAETAA